MWRQFVLERDVAVRPFPEIVTVDPNLAIAIDAVKLDKDRLPFRSHGHREGLPIPADAARQRAAASARRSLFTELTFDAPIVRQLKSSPLRIVQTSVRPVGNITELKAPILVERDSCAGPRIGKTQGSSEKNKKTSRNDDKFSRHGV